jgi:hypothetical protein
MAENEYLATRLFTDRTSAEQEYEALVARGYSPKDVNVVMTEEGRKRHFGDGSVKTELGATRRSREPVSEAASARSPAVPSPR